MKPYEGYPTHLGEGLADHDLIDLKPAELARAAVGSVVKAGALTVLAQDQIEAAVEQGDTESAAAYTETLHKLVRLANPRPFKYT